MEPIFRPASTDLEKAFVAYVQEEVESSPEVLSLSNSKMVEHFKLNNRFNLLSRKRMLELLRQRNLSSEVYNQKISSREQRKFHVPIEASFPFEDIQVDLADMNSVRSDPNTNRQMNDRYLLVMIDVFSRFLFVRPLRNRIHAPYTPNTLSNAKGIVGDEGIVAAMKMFWMKLP
jgi:hypothetical protein